MRFYNKVLSAFFLLVSPLILAQEVAEAPKALAEIIAEKHYQHPPAAEFMGLDPAAVNDHLHRLDPYSQYLTAEEFEDQQRFRSRVGLGLGINVLTKDDRYVAIPFKDGPAYQAGLTRAELLLAVNGRIFSPNKYRIHQASTESGEEVILVTALPDYGEVHRYMVTTGYYAHPPLELIDAADRKVIRIHEFQSRMTGEELKQLLRSWNKDNDQIVIDLRYCPGGSLFEAIDAVSLFLPEGKPLIDLQDNTGVLDQYFATGTDLAKGLPVTILVSQHTASAAEVFAMVLQQHGRATIIGSRTQGKCLVQQEFELDDGSVAQLSVYEAYGPNGETCQGSGIRPNIEVVSSEFLDTSQLLAKGIRAQTSYICQERSYASLESAKVSGWNLLHSTTLGDIDVILLQPDAAMELWMVCLGPIKPADKAKTLREKVERLLAQPFHVVRPSLDPYNE